MWLDLVVLPLGLGLLGFIEPCSIGTNLVFLRFMEGKDAATRGIQALLFTASRAVVLAGIGGSAGYLGMSFFDLQRGGWIALGTVYVVLGGVYLVGGAAGLKRRLGPILPPLTPRPGSVLLGAVFGINVPACAVPLVLALTGKAAIGGVAGPDRVTTGIVSLGLFGLALSLPLVVAAIWTPARRVLDRALGLARGLPVVIGIVFLGLGLWSIHFGLAATPAP